MYWANFLHLYQPPNQVPEIFDRIVSESYKPLVDTLVKYPQIKITLNITGALSEQFLKLGHEDIIKGLVTAGDRGQIEFTDSAKYHPLLPLMPENEIRRQIKLNRETNQKIFGKCYHPKGFFPPEMAYDPKLAPILADLGYEWIILDEISWGYQEGLYGQDLIYTIKDTPLKVYFRERQPSNLIMSALARRIEDFNELYSQEYQQSHYMITAMDGETFGHHRPGLQDLLTELLLSTDFKHVFFSELPNLFVKTGVVSPITSTWASTQNDIDHGIQFLTWRDPKNIVHSWLWELLYLTMEHVNAFDVSDARIVIAREKLDQAIASDYFFWASGKPWWSLEMVEFGAWRMLDTLKSVPGVSSDVIAKGNDLYFKIIATIFEWQRSGYIRQLYKENIDKARVPMKISTEREPWVYKAFIDLMKQAMKAAAAKQKYEEAILWRDAVWKLETKNDIYDAVHVIDLLRKQVSNEEIMAMIDKHRLEYKKVASGQPEARG